MERTGYRYLTCQLRPVMDSDIVDGKVVSRQRYVVTVTGTGGVHVTDLIGDTAPEALRKVAMWMESEAFDF